MSTEKEYKKYKNFAGFENLDKNATPYEQMITGTANDMKNRNTDIEVKRIRESSIFYSLFD